MPAFPIIDTHVHLWDLARLPYAWLAGEPAINRTHNLADFDLARGPVALAKMVFVECGGAPSSSEVEWVTSVAQREPRLQGIVARVSLEAGPEVEAELARLTSHPLVKGVRRLIQGEAAGFCLQPSFVRGVQLLPEFGLSFDICINHTQLANTIRLVRQCPDVKFVLDHIGKPDIKGGRLDPWRAELKELAAMPNVWCKLSGLVTEADHAKWTPADLQPYIDHVIATFGFDRVMFGGDWPVSTQASDYPRWVETVDGALRDASVDDLKKLYVTSAEVFYRI